MNQSRASAMAALPILQLDDETEIGRALARDLRGVAEVQSFSDPKAALAAVEASDYAVILSDLKMPGMDGLEFLSRCAQLRPLAQRVLLTAYGDLADLFESVNKAQINVLLAKPWEPTELRAAVEGALRAGQMARENQELRRIALQDALTGVANHRYFWERLDSEFSRAKRYGRPLSLIMCDVDNFKKYNDQVGHQEGDRVLRAVAQELERAKRAMDTVARYGGEEFAIILPEATRAQGIEIASRFLERVQQNTGISLSFGVAAQPDDAPSPTELVHAADQALLLAKNEGKARVKSAADLKT